MARVLVTQWTELAPFRGPQDEEILAVGDLHRQAEALERLLDHIRRTPRHARRRTLVFLGDVTDRGPEPRERRTWRSTAPGSRSPRHRCSCQETSS